MKHRWIKTTKLINDNIVYITEKWYPFVLSMLLVFFYFIILKNIKIVDDKDTIINAVLSFASILSGFIGTLVGLLFSLSDNQIVKYIFNDIHYKKLMKVFFIRVFQASLVLILCSIILFFRNTIISIKIQSFTFYSFMELTKVLWLFSLSYFSLSSYRIINIIIKIAFNNNYSSNDTNEDEENEFNQEEYDKVREVYEMKR
jgi:hypothetical protein